ncbi:MAG: hypothetical protein P8020_20640 [Acidobacteriota bacterium]
MGFINKQETEASAFVTASLSAAVGERQLSVKTPGGTSNALPFTVKPEHPAPQINSISPASGRPGRSFNMTISGEDIDNITSVNFEPAAGISVSNIQDYHTGLSALVSIASGTAEGQRQVSITGLGGTSNSLAFSVLAPAAGTAPTISNVEIGDLEYSGNKVSLTIDFDFADPDADIVYVPGQPDQSAALILDAGCSKATHSGSIFDRLGEISGHIGFVLTITGYSSHARTVTVQLRDAEGSLSNVLTFQISVWSC